MILVYYAPMSITFENTCFICQTIFVGKNSRVKFCSVVCRAKRAAIRSGKNYHDRQAGVILNRNDRPRNCVNCSVNFTDRGKSPFCSTKCYHQKYLRDRKTIKVVGHCEQCQDQLPDGCKKFCSAVCNNKHYRERHKDRLRNIKRGQVEQQMINRTRARAKKNGLEFNLTIDDISIPDVCPVLGIRIFSNIKDGSMGPCDNSPSIDKIFPNKGYVRGNIRVISYRANLLKSNATVEEMRLVLADLENHVARSLSDC